MAVRNRIVLTVNLTVIDLPVSFVIYGSWQGFVLH